MPVQYQQHMPSQISSPNTLYSDSLDSSSYSSSDSSLNQSYQGDLNAYSTSNSRGFHHPLHFHVQNDSSYFSRNNSYNEESHVNSSPPKQIDSLKYFSIDAILSAPKSSIAAVVKQEEVVNVRNKPTVKRKAADVLDNKVADSKRARTIFTQEQLNALEVEFEKQQYMVGTERTYLAKALGLTESQVKIWFQNRRIKWRKTVDGSVASDDLE